jgi:hypothetical protein
VTSYLTEKLSKPSSLTGNSAGLRPVLSTRLSYRELRSSLRESDSFLILPADTTMASSQGTQSSKIMKEWRPLRSLKRTDRYLKTHITDKITDKPDGKHVLCQRTFISVVRAVFFVLCLTFWHRNFILHTLYIKCKNTGPNKGKIMK